MKFNYQARTKTGQIQSGTIEAASREGAVALLQKYGLYITFLEKAEAVPIYAKRIKIFERISTKEVVLFSRQLSIMFSSKVPLVEALRVLSNQIENPHFSEKILKLSEEVEGGTSLSRALSHYPEIFSSFYISMVKAGEASGKLSESLAYLADHLEREYHFYSKMRGAMIYPCLIFFVVLIVLALMTLFVIPHLTTILKESGQELPVITKMVIGFTDFLRTEGWILILGFIALIIFIFRYYKTEGGKKFFDKIFLKLPWIGPFLKMVYLARFAENLSTLISGGLPIARSLEITGEIVGNTVYREIIFQTRDEVRKGGAISSVLGRFPEVFPPVFIQMTLVGEKTGTLDRTLMNIVDFYRKEVDISIGHLLNILEPALIIFLGLIVGGLIASILLPLYQIVTF